ncbi:MAG: hypothetical protein N3I35_03330 [Clostridia bacterium]|nr:hypothetical protein [Clostridia bacterium]
MICKDCKSFKPEKNIEAAKEIAPESVKGKCNVNNKSCMSGDNCGCGGYVKK